MKIRGCRFLGAFHINAIVLYPFILFKDRDPDPEIVRHESVHVEQVRRLGFVRFYFLYLQEYVEGRKQGLSHHQAYRNISFEREAYGDDAQDVRTLTENRRSP